MPSPLKSLIARRREHREVDRLSPAELDDIGLTLGEMHTMISTPPGVIGRQAEMARRFGLTSADFHEVRHDFADAINQCHRCRAVKQCQHFLAHDQATANDADFCPNREFYLALTAQH